MESDDWSVYRSVETETGRGGKGRMDTPPRILPSIHEDDKEYLWGRSKKKRKMKQQVLGENWGLEEEDNIKTMKEDDRNQDTKGEEARLNVEDMTLKEPRVPDDEDPRYDPVQEPGPLDDWRRRLTDRPLQDISHKPRDELKVLNF